jgi:hypothetical protein
MNRLETTRRRSSDKLRVPALTEGQEFEVEILKKPTQTPPHERHDRPAIFLTLIVHILGEQISGDTIASEVMHTILGSAAQIPVYRLVLIDSTTARSANSSSAEMDEGCSPNTIFKVTSCVGALDPGQRIDQEKCSPSRLELPAQQTDC